MTIAAVLEDEPLALYPLSEAAGVDALDVSGNDRHGTHINDPTRLRCATEYNGTDEDTEFGDAALQLPLTGGTIEGWLWMDPTPGVQLFIGRDHSGDPFGDNGWMLFTTKSGATILNELSYRVGGTEYFTGLDVDVIRVQEWVHAALTYDAAGTALYLDGLLVHTGGAPGAAPVALPWHIAKNGELPEYTPTRAARWAFFDRKLTAERIAAHAFGAPPCSARRPVMGSIGIR